MVARSQNSLQPMTTTQEKLLLAISGKTELLRTWQKHALNNGGETDAERVYLHGLRDRIRSLRVRYNHTRPEQTPRWEKL